MKEWAIDGRGLRELTDAEVWRYIWWVEFLTEEDERELRAEFDRRGFKIVMR